MAVENLEESGLFNLCEESKISKGLTLSSRDIGSDNILQLSVTTDKLLVDIGSGSVISATWEIHPAH